MNRRVYVGLFLALLSLLYVGVNRMQAVRALESPRAIRGIFEQPTDTGIASTPEYFLKIDGIPGESTDDKHKGEIDILSFSWGETQPASIGGKVSMQDFHFVMKYNKASPKLFLGCASGRHFPKAILTLRKAGGGQEYLNWKLTDVVCSAYQTAGTNPNVPTDMFDLSFSKIEVEYKAQKPDGTLEAPINDGWDKQANKSM